ncbi:MAG: hypothetical protein RIA63_11655 [Cyclobacteriaceae bacterium]
MFTLGVVLIAFTSYNLFSSLEIFVLITLYASLYIGVVMRGHLVDGEERSPDLVVPGLLACLYFIDQVPGSLFWVITIYLFARVCLLVIQTFSVLKVFWVWSNPRA